MRQGAESPESSGPHDEVRLKYNERVNSKLILIVEDEEDDARLLELLLAEVGISNPIRIVLSAEEAVLYLQQAPPYSNPLLHPPPAIIFLDLKLPGIDGFELLRHLKTHPEWQNLFVVVLSATGDLASVQHAYSLGANSFLIKPCRIADLENLITGYPDFWTRIPPGLPLPPPNDAPLPPPVQ